MRRLPEALSFSAAFLMPVSTLAARLLVRKNTFGDGHSSERILSIPGRIS
jgi:hypothetical protein